MNAGLSATARALFSLARCRLNRPPLQYAEKARTRTVCSRQSGFTTSTHQTPEFNASRLLAGSSSGVGLLSWAPQLLGLACLGGRTPAAAPASGASTAPPVSTSYSSTSRGVSTAGPCMLADGRGRIRARRPLYADEQAHAQELCNVPQDGQRQNGRMNDRMAE